VDVFATRLAGTGCSCNRSPRCDRLNFRMRDYSNTVPDIACVQELRHSCCRLCQHYSTSFSPLRTVKDTAMPLGSWWSQMAVVVLRWRPGTPAEYSSENIFQPLGMKNTLFDDDKGLVIPYRVAAYESRKDGQLSRSRNRLCCLRQRSWGNFCHIGVTQKRPTTFPSLSHPPGKCSRSVSSPER
jgi:hypothetical protein